MTEFDPIAILLAQALALMLTLGAGVLLALAIRYRKAHRTHQTAEHTLVMAAGLLTTALGVLIVTLGYHQIGLAMVLGSLLVKVAYQLVAGPLRQED